MSPIVLLAGAALILLALSKSKTDPATGKVDPATCLPFVAQKLAAGMPGFQLPSGFVLPQTATDILATLSSTQPAVLRLLGAALRSAGKVSEAECVEAYAEALEAQPPTIPATPVQPPAPGPVVMGPQRRPMGSRTTPQAGVPKPPGAGGQ